MRLHLALLPVVFLACAPASPDANWTSTAMRLADAEDLGSPLLEGAPPEVARQRAKLESEGAAASIHMLSFKLDRTLHRAWVIDARQGERVIRELFTEEGAFVSRASAGWTEGRWRIAWE
jgi:hypothetical protein